MGRSPVLSWRCRGRDLQIGPRPLVMGIINTTPDSFSDGGRYQAAEAAIRHGLAMANDGADMVDIGGESTRPGSTPVSAAEEMDRVIPVVKALVAAFAANPDAPLISIDTRKAEVAQRALECGAHIVNDVSALEGDPGMTEVVRRHGAGVVLMHMKGDPATMQQDPQYGDVVVEVSAYLSGRLVALERAGLDPAAMALDPGIGFGKTVEHNLRLVSELPALTLCGRPVVVGLSRKKFIGMITGGGVGDRLSGSLAAAVWAASRGAHIWRVHDVKESVDAARMVAAFKKEMAEWNG